MYGQVHLECRECGTKASLRNQLVNGVPLEQWWRLVGQRCRGCRVSVSRAEKLTLSHRDGHDTEHAAARSMDEVSGRLRQEVLGHLTAVWPEGLTDDEGGVRMNGDRLTFGRRRKELVDQGLVTKTDERRATPTGRKAIVWKLKEAP